MTNLVGVLYAVILLVLCAGYVDVARGQTTDPTEVNALKAIKASLVDPSNKLKNWGSGDPCTSNWTGIFCDKIPSDSYLHVTEIQLFKMNLSGTLAPEIGLLPQLKTLDFMWNNLTGNIPKEVGNITTLKLITLNGNLLSGSLPDEIGYLMNLNRLQIDENNISGPIPKSFANLTSIKHLHMNNNSLSGQIPSELSSLPALLHLLVDNNNLSGPLPPELADTRSLEILQADNNNFSGSSIPAEYSNIRTLLKLSLRNCSLQGAVPDLSVVPKFGYLDLSWNQLKGSIPTNRLASNITTIDLSHNFLQGTVPSNFSGLPNIQYLSVNGNLLNGSVPPTIWSNITFTGNRALVLDFQNNSLDTIPPVFEPPQNVTVLLYGNPVCTASNAARAANLCQPTSVTDAPSGEGKQVSTTCFPCPTNFEYNPSSPIPCFCAAPLGVGFRLKSPGISDFRPYKEAFENDLTSLLELRVYQLYIERYIWEAGPRLNTHLKLFPNNTNLFDMAEVVRLREVLAGWQITLLDVFGPYELLNFTLGFYADEFRTAASPGLKGGALAGILVGTIVAAIAVSVFSTVFIMKRRRKQRTISRRSLLSRFSVKVDGVKCFTFDEMAVATRDFDISAQVGQGGYGKVYRGNLADGTTVAIKRAHEDSLQGSKEFCTEIELLSRLHHRNLVSLVGYCDEEDEQMLVYEFMPNGTLRDHLSAKTERPLSFGQRVHIALGAAKGLLYLHTEANPPIFHRDVKASNILLDSKFVAKVADFGLSRLAPVPDIEGTLPAHISTVVKGTPGYLDPEYFLTHKLTERSDVYSLGVVFLELLTGMKPIQHGKNIVREVNIAYQSGDVSGIIDSRMSSYPPECVKRFLSLAIRCCRDDTEERPYMADIVRELETIRSMLPEGEDVLSSTSGSGLLAKSMSSSSTTTTGALYVSSHISGSGQADSGIPSGMVAPR
ncbi:probable LRR receptor-like serine/threonine-protein kinase At1g06840 isoform X1 [Zea mays]|uniref:non-specific serine/threonine protein kinase n=2 Tax=Zea mays TaxID=4577 RepID=A0A096QE31_MAIZE|nr:probable LRR receptor-like serine/threonine-protein kinase At1g06840 isoform X1 [Zea mays]ONM36852.1 Leucine-rich repeat protein kinase family protein [Zea mays]ONM36859.1 Leucine-rich repeat protein kinase family protein [Zea mays]|eukprot:XP_008652663.1 probable LRR receptor-like serine/threonine-protein kinase At1g06840 isoform X1 [Zea mays]